VPQGRFRSYRILAGYSVQNDHGTLRKDPVSKLVADRSPAEDDLASQPTLSRFESAISIKSLKRVRDLFIDLFIASFDTPPRPLTFDLDAVRGRRRSRYIMTPAGRMPTWPAAVHAAGFLSSPQGKM
jgi:hypothetical protein